MGSTTPLHHRQIEIRVSDAELAEYTRQVSQTSIAEGELGRPEVQEKIQEVIVGIFAEVGSVITEVNKLISRNDASPTCPEYYIIRGTRFNELPYSPAKDVRGSFVVGLSSFWGDPALGNYHQPDSNFAYRHIKARPIQPSEQISLLNSTRAGFPHTDSTFKPNPEPLFALFMQKAATNGGDSLVWNVLSLIEWIDAQPNGREAIEIMRDREFPFVGSILDPDRLLLAPVLLDGSGERMRYKRDAIEDGAKTLGRTLSDEEMLVADMIDRACDSAELTVRFGLDDGDAVVLDNQRTLHSRMPFSDRGRHVLKTTMALRH